MTPQDFSAWVKDAQHNGVALNAANYKILGESSTPEQVRAHFGSPSMPKDVTFFNNAEPDFFKNIVMRYHGRKPVPPAQQPGTTVYDAKIAGNTVPKAGMAGKSQARMASKPQAKMASK